MRNFLAHMDLSSAKLPAPHEPIGRVTSYSARIYRATNVLFRTNLSRNFLFRMNLPFGQPPFRMNLLRENFLLHMNLSRGGTAYPH